VLVIDASVAVQAALGEAGFEPLAGEEAVAPALLWSEAASALHELAWRRVVPAEHARQALERLLSGPIVQRQPRNLTAEAWAVADELGWAKTYDAEYVALARLLEAPLVTMDARLARGASRVIRAVGPTEL